MLNRLVWRYSQILEKRYWLSFLKESGSSDEKWLNVVAKYFELDNVDFSGLSLVDIGSGPIGILTKLKAKERIAVDPLHIQSVDNSIRRIFSPGEEIPLTPNTADCVFLYNVLQHVYSPEKVLKEGTRILKEGGTFYVLEQLNIPTSPGHQNTLTLKLFTDWVSKNNLEVLKQTIETNKSFNYFDGGHANNADWSIYCLIVRKSVPKDQLNKI
jgi:ubiquinone/menaquinone biosynthesis C-methylase UbiE